MKEAIEGYIRAVEENIAEYQKIEDPVERHRSLEAAYGMLEGFLSYLSKLEVDATAG
jgi:hypothetical protein